MNKKRIIIIFLLFIKFSCLQLYAQEEFGKFKGKVVGCWMDNENGPDREMQLIKDFSYIDSKGSEWKAPKGSIIDGASIPSLLWSKWIGTPFVGDYRKASVVHDVACEQKNRPHREVHMMFYEACVCGGMSQKEAEKFYWAVRKFGPKWDQKGIVISKWDEQGIEQAKWDIIYLDTTKDQANEEMEIILKKIDAKDIPIDKLEVMIDNALGDY